MGIVSKPPNGAPGLVFGLLGLAAAIGLVAVVIILWSAEAARPGSKALTPTPVAAFAALGGLADDPRFWRAVGATLTDWPAGFAAAAVAGLAIGIYAGRSRRLAALAGPALFVVATLPASVLPLLFVIWEGVDSRTGARISAALLAFLAIAAIAAVAQRSADAVARWQGAFGALAIGAVLALTAVVFVEGIAGRDRFGTMVFEAFSTFNTPRMFAMFLALWILGFVLALPFALAGWILGLRR